jgi:hypothetical protein
MAGIKIDKPGLPLGECDIWMLCLMTFPGGDATLTFDELLARPHKLVSASAMTEGGHERIEVELTMSTTGTGLSIRFDRSVNYLASKLVVTRAIQGGPMVRNEWTVDEFFEADPGVFFPRRVTQSAFADGQLAQSSSYTFKNVTVNRPIPDDEFTIQYPNGVDVLDWVENRTYRVDSAGNIVGPSRVRLGRTTRTAPDADATNGAGGAEAELVKPREATTVEPKSWTRWLLPASGCLLFFALLVRAVKRRAASPEDIK